MALAALSQAEVPWRIACTSENLSGVVAATRAGLGVATLARNLVPDGLAAIPPQAGLPGLGMLDFILLRHPRAPKAPVSELAAAIVAKGARIEARVRMRSPPAQGQTSRRRTSGR